MRLKLHAGPATYDELIEFGWSPSSARLLLDDPEQLLRTLVDQAGWPERFARSHIDNPLLPIDYVDGMMYSPESLDASMRQSQSAAAPTRR